jgi:hypothetical protein
LIVFPISTEAVVLALVPVVGAAPALVVVVALLFLAVLAPPGGLAVELQPASTKAATAGARTTAASLDEWSVMWARIATRFPSLIAVPQPGTC